jgi:hypothetical protein
MIFGIPNVLDKSERGIARIGSFALRHIPALGRRLASFGGYGIGIGDTVEAATKAAEQSASLRGKPKIYSESEEKEVEKAEDLDSAKLPSPAAVLQFFRQHAEDYERRMAPTEPPAQPTEQMVADSRLQRSAGLSKAHTFKGLPIPWAPKQDGMPPGTVVGGKQKVDTLEGAAWRSLRSGKVAGVKPRDPGGKNPEVASALHPGD